MVTMSFNLMDARVVLAQFPNTADKDYAYFVPEGDDPKVGDVILTSTSWDTFMTPSAVAHASAHYQSMALDAKLARIIDVLETGHPKATRFYMKLVSVEQLAATHARNVDLAKKAKVRADAYAKLDKMMESFNRVEMYRHLAASNPEAAKLLEQLEELNPPQWTPVRHAPAGAKPVKSSRR